ncbi:transporter substrate-binding domain-containing protein [Cupriavidus basilensis]
MPRPCSRCWSWPAPGRGPGTDRRRDRQEGQGHHRRGDGRAALRHTTDATGKPAGYDVDVANLLGKYLGVPVDIVPLTSPSRIPALEAGKVDFLVATLAPTPERARPSCSAPPYSAFELTIFAPVAAKYAKLAELGKKKVGVTRGTTQDTALTRLAVPGMNIVRFEDDATCAQARSATRSKPLPCPTPPATKS